MKLLLNADRRENERRKGTENVLEEKLSLKMNSRKFKL
jgi:hypothetical protein